VGEKPLEEAKMLPPVYERMIYGKTKYKMV
jgi:hypothetical protein